MNGDIGECHLNIIPRQGLVSNTELYSLSLLPLVIRSLFSLLSFAICSLFHFSLTFAIDRGLSVVIKANHSISSCNNAQHLDSTSHCIATEECSTSEPVPLVQSVQSIDDISHRLDRQIKLRGIRMQIKLIFHLICQRLIAFEKLGGFVQPQKV